MSPSGIRVPCAQVTPTAPYPTTASGTLTISGPSSAPALARARATPGTAAREPAGAVRAYSRTLGSTTSVGTFDGRAVARVYAARSADSELAAGSSGTSRTTSRLTTLAAGVRAARTTPRAKSCWQAVTKLVLLGGIRRTPVRGEVHTRAQLSHASQDLGRGSE